MNINEIARQRCEKLLKLAGEAVDVNTLLNAEAQRDIAGAFAKFGLGNLSGAVELVRSLLS